jgi:hypothetical protein
MFCLNKIKSFLETRLASGYSLCKQGILQFGTGSCSESTSSEE